MKAGLQELSRLDVPSRSHRCSESRTYRQHGVPVAGSAVEYYPHACAAAVEPHHRQNPFPPQIGVTMYTTDNGWRLLASKSHAMLAEAMAGLVELSVLPWQSNGIISRSQVSREHQWGQHNPEGLYTITQSSGVFSRLRLSQEHQQGQQNPEGVYREHIAPESCRGSRCLESISRVTTTHRGYNENSSSEDNVLKQFTAPSWIATH